MRIGTGRLSTGQCAKVASIAKRRFRHEPLIGVKIHGDPARFGDVRCKRGNQILLAEHMLHELVHVVKKPVNGATAQVADSTLDAGIRAAEKLLRSRR